jgi:hypothetical protein
MFNQYQKIIMKGTKVWKTKNKWHDLLHDPNCLKNKQICLA